MTRPRIAAFALLALGSFASTVALAASPAQHCKSGKAMHIRGDVPGAISFDVYRQLRGDPKRIALFQDEGSVHQLADGTQVCETADDGVDDPSAVLVHAPDGHMAWWVDASNVSAAD